MSAASALPDSQTAFENLMAGAYERVYFHKLASVYNHAPRNAGEARALLDIGFRLRAAEEEQQKQAGDLASPYVQASLDLARELADRGLDAGVKQASYARQEQQAYAYADALASDPTIYNSVLALKAAEAEEWSRGQTAAA